MKPTYDAYSKSFLALKAACLPLLLAILKTWSECFPKDYKESLLGLSVALLIFSVDIFANYIAALLNANAIDRQLKQIDSNILRLNACLTANIQAPNKKAIQAKIGKLEKQKIELLGN